MRILRADPRYRPVARRRWALKPVLWGLGAFLLFWAGAFGVWHVSQSLSVTPQRDYAGSISPNQDRIAVSLPAYAILDRLVISEGDQVTAGQTVATLDKAAMEARLGEIERALEAARGAIACFLKGQDASILDVSVSMRTQGSENVAPSESLQSSENSRDGSTLDLSDCHTVHAEYESTSDQIERRRQVLLDDRQSVEEYIGVGAWIDKKMDAETLKRRIALSFLRTEIDKELLKQEEMASKARLAYEHRVTEMTRLRSAEIEDLSREEDRLSKFIAAPRLAAPIDGVVSRARPVRSKSTLQDDVDIIELLPNGTVEYTAFFDAPLGDASHLSSGQPVQMRPLGEYRTALPLTGNVTDMKSARDGLVRVMVALDPESTAMLSDPDIGLAFGGPETASRVTVRLAAEPMLDLLVRSLSEAVSGPVWNAKG